MDTNDQHATYIAAHNESLDTLAALTASHERTVKVTRLEARVRPDHDDPSTPAVDWSATIGGPSDQPPSSYGVASAWMAVHVLAAHDDIAWLLDERLRLQGLLVDATMTITDLHATIDALVAAADHPTPPPPTAPFEVLGTSGPQGLIATQSGPVYPATQPDAPLPSPHAEQWPTEPLPTGQPVDPTQVIATAEAVDLTTAKPTVDGGEPDTILPTPST